MRRLYGVHLCPTIAPNIKLSVVNEELMKMLRNMGTVEVSITSLSQALRQGDDVYAIEVAPNGERVFAIKIVP